MVETVTTCAYRAGEAVATSIGDAAFISVVLLLSAFWMLILRMLLQDD
jgi:hypothetical protein